MRFGLAIQNDFPPNLRPADRVGPMREQVAAAAEAGFSSVWMLQHYLGNLPTLQPIPTLAAIAAEAGDMAVGTNMLILPLHHPVEVAETYATLDHLSGGRAVAGFGLGYRENEFESFGVPLSERVTRYEESVAIVRALWTAEPVDFTGRHYALKGQRISLPPVRPGGPPIWVGAGAHRTGARRAARLGDAWIVPPHVTPERLTTVLRWYRDAGGQDVVVRRELVLDPDPERAMAVGRAARGALTRAYSAFNAPDATESYRQLSDAGAAQDVAAHSYLFTTPEECVRRLGELADLGVTYVILRMQWYDLPQERMLRTLALFRDEVLPHFQTTFPKTGG
ncbi:LLM class flavin-dependent oxidoreductase [Phytohabitans sp. ZYX-F-186]|uniref:LLM class flavin-dependent oxidoreductase n=1 Tax=Phytohabitans maris TaxID=3071409 RepID=A0ABU0Z9Y4_9ACTN|nr:LLM class flavin-dependent oxidoreductase [Phytohabitans sp. ZYX-F-186]MDQ7903803.1 LLM class flavin-dependent oxidoreductase [Phytohabitans sp. ZYX-F-186]